MYHFGLKLESWSASCGWRAPLRRGLAHTGEACPDLERPQPWPQVLEGLSGHNFPGVPSGAGAPGSRSAGARSLFSPRPQGLQLQRAGSYCPAAHGRSPGMEQAWRGPQPGSSSFPRHPLNPPSRKPCEHHRNPHWSTETWCPPSASRFSGLYKVFFQRKHRSNLTWNSGLVRGPWGRSFPKQREQKASFKKL